MTEQEFLTKFKDDILNTEANINLDTRLENVLEWDSLTFVSFMAMAMTTSQKDIDHQAVRQAQTVRELYNFL